MLRIIHFEIHADEPECAIRFYHSVFGWDFMPIKSMPVEYWVIMTGESSQPGIDGELMRGSRLWTAPLSLRLCAPWRCRTWINT